MSKLKKAKQAIEKKADIKKEKIIKAKLVENLIQVKHVKFSTVTGKLKFDRKNVTVTITGKVELFQKFKVNGKQSLYLPFEFTYIPVNVHLKKPAHLFKTVTGWKVDKSNSFSTEAVRGKLNNRCKHLLDEFRKLDEKSNKLIVAAIRSKKKATKKEEPKVKIKGKKSANGKIKQSAKSAGKKPIKNNNKKKVTKKTNKK